MELEAIRSNLASNKSFMSDESLTETFKIVRKIAHSGKFEEALALLFEMEKHSRNAADMNSCMQILKEIVKLCGKAKNWTRLNECILLLGTKRAILKEAITSMVQEAMKYIEGITNKDDKLNLINTLRSVSQGKIYVEVERARLSKMLADIKEREGDIDGAMEILNELKVETLGSMDEREKTKMIINQMRLAIVKKNIDFGQILSNKISKRFLDKPENEDIKIEYYNFKILLDRDSSYLKTSQHFYEIANCTKISDTSRNKMMGNVFLYCILAPYNADKYIMVENLKNSSLAKAKNCAASIIFEQFTIKELINTSRFYDQNSKNLLKYEVFNDKTAHGKTCLADLEKRLNEHNILVISRYYSQIYIKRLQELLNITEKQCEDYITVLVNSKEVNAKIDRPLGIVKFSKNKNSMEVLNDWSYNVGTLMKKVNHTSYAILNKSWNPNTSSNTEDIESLNNM